MAARDGEGCAGCLLALLFLFGPPGWFLMLLFLYAYVWNPPRGTR
jgi:hypothetical protein